MRRRKPGIYPRLSRSAYEAIDALNASLLVHGVRSMLHMRHAENNPTDDTPAMRWGRLVHMAVLEPHTLDRDVAVWEGESRRGNEYKEFVEANQGKTVVTQPEITLLTSMVDAVSRNHVVTQLLAGCRRECTVLWRDDEYGDAKARLDGLSNDAIIDLKTTGDIDMERFRNTAARLLYHVRLGWYRAGVRAVTGRELPVYVVSVEADPPHDCVIYEYDAFALGAGSDVARATAVRWRECQRTGVYPGVCGDIRPLKLPTWMTAGDAPVALRVGGEQVEI